MGGSLDRSLPHIPASISDLRFGRSLRHRSKTSCGVAQSSPMTITLFFMNASFRCSPTGPGTETLFSPLQDHHFAEHAAGSKILVYKVAHRPIRFGREILLARDDQSYLPGIE